MYSYFVLNRIYESFLKLNPIIKKYGFVFESYNHSDLFRDFDKIICFGCDPRDAIERSSFFLRSPMYDFFTISDRPMILLKSTESQEKRIKDNNKNRQHVNQKDKEFVNKLISILRLYKEGMIELNMYFYYDIETKKCTETGTYIYSKRSLITKEYIIEDEDISEIEKKLASNLIINDLSKLAYESFMQSYTIDNIKLRYLTLMISLESLFNLGTDQISHTISRHLSLLISETKDVFQENYKKIKKLYDLRSKIIHGSPSLIEVLKTEISVLERMVRAALNFSLSKELSKKELFDLLNSKGF
ncbi:MAG: hypothetical protein JXB49_31520 [Bacteroidales bacterium]|nr:hypothetical protein [Bacteroidales bacterium]